MARPKKVAARTVADIEAALVEEGEQLALLRRDLRDALVLGENTRPFRAALAATDKEISALQSALLSSREEEASRRQAEIDIDVRVICEESSTAHAAFLATMTFPTLEEGA